MAAAMALAAMRSVGRRAGVPAAAVGGGGVRRRRQVKFADQVEAARKAAVAAMKAGGTLVVDLSDVGARDELPRYEKIRFHTV